MSYYNRNKGDESTETELRLPKNGEVIGKVTKVVGASRFQVECSDGKNRLCDIPGRFRRRFWIKENDTVLVQPWTVQSDERGDIIWKYSLMAISKLKDKHLI